MQGTVVRLARATAQDALRHLAGLVVWHSDEKTRPVSAATGFETAYSQNPYPVAAEISSLKLQVLTVNAHACLSGPSAGLMVMLCHVLVKQLSEFYNFIG